MRVLAIREPWASLIMNGDKELEIRSQPTKIRERIAIYASRTKMKQQELEWLERRHVEIPDTHQGNVLGTVDLINCTKKNLKSENFSRHLTNPSWFKKETYGWLIHEPIKCVPFEWKMPKGTVVWAPIDYSDMLLSVNMVYTNGIDIVKFDTSKAKPAVDDEVCVCRDGRVTSLTPYRIGVVGTRVNDDMASRELKLDEILIRLL